MFKFIIDANHNLFLNCNHIGWIITSILAYADGIFTIKIWFNRCLSRPHETEQNPPYPSRMGNFRLFLIHFPPKFFSCLRLWPINRSDQISLLIYRWFVAYVCGCVGVVFKHASFSCTRSRQIFTNFGQYISLHSTTFGDLWIENGQKKTLFGWEKQQEKNAN